MSWGSNTLPSKFGKGGETPADWDCICGEHNKKWYSKCVMCGITKSLSNLAKERINSD